MTERIDTYACGNTPMVGDLIEFGTRHERLLVLAINDDAAKFSINASGREYSGTLLNLMVLVARHGGKEKANDR